MQQARVSQAAIRLHFLFWIFLFVLQENRCQNNIATGQKGSNISNSEGAKENISNSSKNSFDIVVVIRVFHLQQLVCN